MLKELSEDERTRMLEESYQKARWDEELRIETALAEGAERGEQKNKIETARNALRIGLSVENIAIITGLTIKEIEGLR